MTTQFFDLMIDTETAGLPPTGALMSGVVMNAAYFALGRALLQWMGTPPWLAAFGVVVLIIGTFTAILAILYAFVFLAFVFTGAGAFSVDAKRG